MVQKRNTKQKTMIFEALHATTSHPTATMLYETLKEQGATMSRSTVYRVLSEAASEGSILKIVDSGDEDRFDGDTKNHYHIRCVVCGNVFDSKLSYMEELNRRAEDVDGFSILSHSIEFQGICPKCRTSQPK